MPYVVTPGGQSAPTPASLRSATSSRSGRQGGGAAAAAAAAAGRVAIAPGRPFAVASEVLRCLLVGEALTYSDMAAIYLCKVYMLCWATLALVIVLAAQAAASHSFLLPHLLPLRFDHDEGWTWRFQLSTLQLFATLRKPMTEGAGACCTMGGLLKSKLIEFADSYYFVMDVLISSSLILALSILSMLPLLRLQSMILFNRDFAKVIQTKLSRAELLKRILS